MMYRERRDLASKKFFACYGDDADEWIEMFDWACRVSARLDDCRGRAADALREPLMLWLEEAAAGGEVEVEPSRQRREYSDVRFCWHCNCDTEHLCRDSGHERDSSGDYQECTACRWYETGIVSGYQPPGGAL